LLSGISLRSKLGYRLGIPAAQVAYLLKFYTPITERDFSALIVRTLIVFRGIYRIIRYYEENTSPENNIRKAINKFPNHLEPIRRSRKSACSNFPQPSFSAPTQIFIERMLRAGKGAIHLLLFLRN